MDSLRLILILVGLLVVAVIYLLGRRREQQNTPSDAADNPVASVAKPEFSQLNDEWDSLSFSTTDSEPLDSDASPLLATLRQGAKLQRQQLEDAALDFLKMSPKENRSDQHSPGGNSSGEKSYVESDQAREWYVVLTVMANEGEHFTGEDIHKALQEAGLHFGEMDIYHDYAAGAEGISLTSVANIIEPGTLKPDENSNLLTPGLALLLRLPTVLAGEEALDRMFDIATQLAENLNGRICDQQRLLLSEEAIDDLRQKAGDYPALPVLWAEVD